jgi:hypothetical protein
MFSSKGMTRTMLLIFAALVSITLSANAQELAPSAVDLTTKPAEQNPARAEATPTPTPPSELPDLPELSQLDEAFKESSLGKTADEFRLHIEWRRLRNQVANDPEIVAAKKAADTARTDLEKRERIRRYYKLFYARMDALTNRPEIKAALADMREKHVGLADQKHVRPSPSPSPSSSPSSSVEPSVNESERPSPLSTLPPETESPAPSSPEPTEP